MTETGSINHADMSQREMNQRGMNRRDLCVGLLAAGVVERCGLGASAKLHNSDAYRMVAGVDRERVLKAASAHLALPVETITAYVSERNPGGVHDYFSEADYFWPDPAHPDGPYINRDGESNPKNFNGHRKAMIALSIRMPALTAAWVLTHDQRYARRACDHLRAWFITPATRMNANLEYAQGVHGVTTGRSYGIIDTLHLVEVARAASLVAPVALASEENAALKDWFRAYLKWMQTSDKGRKERDAENNHAMCWALQAAEFARLIDDSETRAQVYRQYTATLLPDQLAVNGSFPKELARTKPYSYSIFNFDVMAALCQSLQGAGADALTFQLADGRGLCRAAEFLYPYLKDKAAWPYAKDVQHFDALPVRSPGLLFAGLACKRQAYIELWRSLNPDPTDAEIIRNYPIRQPLLWVA
jgi:Alginate lyase